MYNEGRQAWIILKTAIILLVFFAILTGIIYPVIVTGIGQLLFPWQANGSLIASNNKMANNKTANNKIIGSVLIGQSFTDAKYFWGRPSATSPFPYNAAISSGSNLGPSSPVLLAAIKDRVMQLQQTNPQNHNLISGDLIPGDLVMSSASGLDPDISPLAAYYQVPRIAKARNVPELTIQLLIQKLIQKPDFGILGEPRVNVLQLNLALDTLENTKVSQ